MNDDLQSIFEHPIVQELAEKAWKDLESEVKLPYVLTEKILMSPGVWNNFYYNDTVIKTIFEKTNWSDPKVRALFLDHVDDRAAEWIGEIINPSFKNGNVIGDLAILDKPTAIKLAYGAKFGVSPKVIGEADYNRKMYDGHFDNFSIVINPAVKTTFLNSEIKIGGKNMSQKKEFEEESEASEEVEEPETDVEELAEKVAEILKKKKYKYPCTEEEELKKKKDEEEMKKKYPYEQMEKRLAEVEAELKKKKEEEEMKKKKDEEELKKKKDEEELKKKKYEYPEEMGEDFATELSAYTDFVKKYLKDHPGASIKEAAKAWGKKHSEELEEVSVSEITVEDLAEKVGQVIEQKMSQDFGLTPIKVSKRFLEPGAGDNLSNADMDAAMDRLIRGEMV